MKNLTAMLFLVWITLPSERQRMYLYLENAAPLKHYKELLANCNY
jgi:hypothetical protein